MKVKLISFTKWPEETCTEAACVCYDKKFTDLEGATERDKYLMGVMNSGHLSVIEHANFTFLVEDVSRALTHQLVRHRIASYSQLSQRYVKMDEPTYVTPPSIMNRMNGRVGDFPKEVFEVVMEKCWDAYNELIKMGIPAEDARFVLPNACTTSIAITMNARELLHFFSLRCCNRAQWEIREMAQYMLDICKQVAPTIFAKAGPSCVRGPCPEGKKSCGNPKTINI